MAENQKDTEQSRIVRHDREFEIGALASRHSISTEQAREIIDLCGEDAECIEEEAHKFKRRH